MSSTKLGQGPLLSSFNIGVSCFLSSAIAPSYLEDFLLIYFKNDPCQD
jgi:hypothetical protein